MGKHNNLLRFAREYKQLTQAQVAEMIGSTSVNVSRWENGVTFPSQYYRAKLCNLLDKSERELGLVRENDGHDALELPIFLFNEPLPVAEEMYGRKRESEILFSRTMRKASTSITGPRRIGKTWLIRYFRMVAPERLGSRFCIGYLDGMSASCKTVNGFVEEALSRLGLPLPEKNQGLVSLDRGLQELVARKQIPVLCIDEFERFSGNAEFSLDFFEGLRAMCHTTDLVLIIASKNPLHLVVSKQAQGSPFFNIFERVLLKPFDYSETERFIQEKGSLANFSPQERDYLWKYGKAEEHEKVWMPLRLQLAGKILVEDGEQARKDPNYRLRFEEQFAMLYEAVTE